MFKFIKLKIATQLNEESFLALIDLPQPHENTNSNGFAAGFYDYLRRSSPCKDSGIEKQARHV